MSPKLSILVPGIRTERWNKLYNSISDACQYPNTWEIIFISPYPLPESLRHYDNVKHIQSWRAPLACQQQGLCEAQGEYISFAADDGEYLPKSLDIALDLLKNEDYKTVITAKYREGDENTDEMVKDWYYTLNNHAGFNSLFIPKDCYMFNCGVASRKILLELGGWDSSTFQVCPIGYNDMAIRLQKYGCKFILQKEEMFKCSHEPGMMGTHGPIHIAQVYSDAPKFEEMYLKSQTRIAVALDNWRYTPERWVLRFG